MYEIFSKFRVEESYIEFLLFYFLRQRYRFANIKITLPYLTIHTLDGKFKCPISDNWDAIYSIDPLVEFALRQEFIIRDEKVIFFDIGAYIGRYAIMLGNMQQRDEVDYLIFGFEPNPSSYIAFKENISLNLLDKVVSIHNLAFSNANGKVTFGKYYSGSKIVLNKEELLDDEPDYEFIEVEAVCGDQFVNNNRNIEIEKNFLLLKIDVEGHELEVLSGLISTLARSKRGKLIVEILPSSKNKDNIFKYLKKCGYEFAYTKSGHNYIFKKGNQK